MPYREKSNYDDFQHIIALASTAGIPKIIIDRRYVIIRILLNKDIPRINRGIIAASIYIACVCIITLEPQKNWLPFLI